MRIHFLLIVQILLFIRIHKCVLCNTIIIVTVNIVLKLHFKSYHKVMLNMLLPSKLNTTYLF